MNQIAAHITENYTGYSASARTIAAVAQGYVDAAGSAGGQQEVEAIARDGWASALTSDARIGDEDHDALRGAIQYAAKLELGQI